METVHNPISRLNAMLHRRTHIYFERQLKPYGLTFTHFRMLMFLSHHEGMRQEDVRAHIDGDKGGVAHSIKRLVELGLVERQPHPEDGRAYVVEMTEQGRELLGELAQIAQRWNEQMIEGFSADELEVAEGLLQRMADNACALIDDECEGKHACTKKHD